MSAHDGVRRRRIQMGCDVTTFETELEHEKSEKISAVADRGATIAAELGQDSERVQDFLRHYFRHVDAADVDERSIEDLLGLVESHYRLALQRPAARAIIEIQSPTAAQDGWSAGGASVVQIVTDDRPFLVDSVTMETLRQGWSIREIFHPQYLVKRDLDGHLTEILSAADAGNQRDVIPESWMHLEALPPVTPEGPSAEELSTTLESGLRDVLRLAEEAVTDWAKMRTRAHETIGLLNDPSLNGGHAEESTRARGLLEWLLEHHFTFLGYREYSLVEHDGTAQYVPVPGTGLGMLRADRDAPDAFQALPQLGHEGDREDLLVITKDNDKSRIHRPAYLDYLGFRQFDADGRVSGERRFLGLFASSAYSEAVARIPLLRDKARAILRRSGYAESSHGGKAVMDVLDTLPRDELFQARLDDLAAMVEKIAHLKERRQVRLFVRRDSYGRYLSCLVYLPRDRYTTQVRNKMQDVLMRQLGGASIDYTARVSESVLARLHFVVRMPVGEAMGDVDVRGLERELTQATKSWNDEFAESVSSSGNAEYLATLVGALPEGYKEDYTAKQGMLDLLALTELENESDMSMAMYRPDRPDDEADLRLKIFRRTEPLSLSKIMPHLSLLGVDVVDERPYELQLGSDRRAFIYDFGVTVPGGDAAVDRHWSPQARRRFIDAFSASYRGLSEPDGFNALVMAADLEWRQVTILRAIGRYLRQGGATYSQSYIANALTANVDLARLLVQLFEAKFDPARPGSMKHRNEEVEDLRDKIKIGLDDVASLDHDRIIRSYLRVSDAIIRTNVYQPGRETTAFKLLPRKIADLPEPRPAYEIFVYSARVEGVHLRFGSVARGGLRWSDRAEDFRTEILGLVKAQMVKNTVIVPVGAKGGFYAKRLPDPSSNREAWLAEGVACYRLFISSLLDLTDNIVDGAVVPPRDVVRYDGDDPYLVVAADKGTATFSDIANSISVDAGFWLGDAFASGGSVGYDHKAMGITARGAWVAVQRHFRELGVDPQTDDFSCVGIGDMSGDVFGNGMLLSRHIKLVAAFDHRHVFIDPDPDPTRSWTERQRLFELPRSSWADYDEDLISAGGGVFPRTLKSIPITEQMRTVLGIGASVTALSPAELISACLCAPVDLLWNGGIGTYVKASSESNGEVGDKANDGLRINGLQLRAKCVGEGGNLGSTQLGRIEYASAGGRINTDFIDNSAGVDTSDHEVNIKILLSGEVRAGQLSGADRDELLASMTDEVAELVLAHNYDQNLALANGVFQAASMAGVHEDWMERLADRKLLDREIEFLPSTEEMAARRGDRRGLTAPELAVLMAYTKIVLANEVLSSPLPDDPYLANRLITYFPTALQDRYADAIREHRLSREIITTVVVNGFVNASGITCFHRLSSETGADAADVIRAHIAVRQVFRAAEHEAAIRALDHQVDAKVQTTLRMEVRTLIERANRWLVNNRRRPIDITSAVEQYGDGVRAVQEQLPQLLAGRDRESFDKKLAGYVAAGVPEDLARATAALPAAYAALTIVQTARSDDRDIADVAAVHFALGHRLGLDRLLARIVELPREDRWQTMARAALRDDLHTLHSRLVAEVMATGDDGAAKDQVAIWEKATPGVADAIRTMRQICEAKPDLARVSVGLRIARTLLSRGG